MAKQAAATTVDRFLNRTLSLQDYACIRLFEPCIVVVSDEPRMFRFLVLSDTMLSCVENPPKSVMPLLALDSITSIELVRPLWWDDKQLDVWEMVASAWTVFPPCVP